MQERKRVGKERKIKVFFEPWGVVYLNGEYIPAEQAKISITDLGFLKGDSVFDVARTFNRKPYKLKQHIERLYKSLKCVRIDPGITKEQMKQITLKVLGKNIHLLGENDDYWLFQRVSRGSCPASFLSDLAHCPSPTVLIYCSPIPFQNFAKLYKTGRKLVTVSVSQVPPECVEPRIKNQSRLNFILAVLEAQEKDPEASPLMRDLEGNITEAWGANFLFVRDGGIMTSNTRMVLEGVTRRTVLELANELGLPVVEGNFTSYDVYTADEAFVTATSYQILPVCSVDGIKIGERIPGPITIRLTKCLSEKIGVDFVGQALSHLNEEERGRLSERQ